MRTQAVISFIPIALFSCSSDNIKWSQPDYYQNRQSIKQETAAKSEAMNSSVSTGPDAVSQNNAGVEIDSQEDESEISIPTELDYRQVTNFALVYQDAGTQAVTDLTLWRPLPVPGFSSLGDVAMRWHGAPQSTVLVRDVKGAVASPDDYRELWNTVGSGSIREASIWQPIPPSGYVCLGHVVQASLIKPSKDLIRCVHKDFVVATASSQLVWELRTKEPETNIGIYTVMGGSEGLAASRSFYLRHMQNKDATSYSLKFEKIKDAGCASE